MRTIFEQIEDGKDIVSRYDSREQRFQSKKVINEEVLMADVSIRKALNNNTFIFFLENIRYENKLDEIDSSNIITYLELPMIVELNNDSSIVQQIRVSNNDTTKSLELKRAALDFSLKNLLKYKTSWGECKITNKVTGEDKFIRDMTNITRSDCEGPKNLDEKPFSNVTPESHVSVTHYFRKTDLDDDGFEFRLFLKDAENPTNVYALERNIFLKEMKTSVKEIHESDFTVNMLTYLL